MKNVAIMLTLLLVPYWALAFPNVAESLRGRIGVVLVFLFTALGHFMKGLEMAQILPAVWIRPLKLQIELCPECALSFVALLK